MKSNGSTRAATREASGGLSDFRDGWERLGAAWWTGTGSSDEVMQQRWQWTREHLARRFGMQPSVWDIAWRLLNGDVIAHGAIGNWRWYRDTRLRMGELLCVEGRWQQGLLTLLEVCYLDLNGPQNQVGRNADQCVAAKSCGFHPKQASLAPAIVERCCYLAARLELNADDLQRCFERVAEQNYRDLRLPVKPQRAWRRLARSIRDAAASAARP